MPRPYCRSYWLLELVDPDDLALERVRGEEREQARDLDVERRRLVVHGEAADLEEREAGRLLRVPERLGGGDLHRLGVGDGDAELAPDPELDERDGQRDDDRELRRAAEDLDVPALQQVPAGDAEHEEARGYQPGKDDMRPGEENEPLEEDVDDVRRLRAAGLRVDLVADGCCIQEFAVRMKYAESQVPSQTR